MTDTAGWIIFMQVSAKQPFISVTLTHCIPEAKAVAVFVVCPLGLHKIV